MPQKYLVLSLGLVALIVVGAILLTISEPSLPAAISSGIGEPEVETDPAKYPVLLADWSSRNLVAHFPKSFPAEATNVRLSSFPGFMQGGAWLQIRFNLPPAQVAAIFADASAQAKAFYDGGDKLSLVNDKEGGLPGTSFLTADAGQKSFPDDYRIFVFSVRDGGGNSFSWNHGDSTGVVVSTKRNEVIYFAESW